METRNVDWKIEHGPDGSLPAEQVTHALLVDIREAARSIRRMLIFFRVLVVINCAILFVWAISSLSSHGETIRNGYGRPTDE